MDNLFRTKNTASSLKVFFKMPLDVSWTFNYFNLSSDFIAVKRQNIVNVYDAKTIFYILVKGHCKMGSHIILKHFIH